MNREINKQQMSGRLILLFAASFLGRLLPEEVVWSWLSVGKRVQLGGVYEAPSLYSVSEPVVTVSGWFGRLIVHLIYQVGGLQLLGVLGSLLVGVTMIYLAKSRFSYLLALIGIAALGVLGLPIYGFYFLFVAIVLSWLSNEEEERPLWHWFLLFLVWVNVTDGFMSGLFLLGVGLIWDLIGLRGGVDKVWLDKGSAFVAALLGSLFNPYGWHLWFLRWEEPFIGRWGYDFHQPSNWLFLILLAVLLFSWLGHDWRPSGKQFLFFVVGVVAGLLSQELLPLLVAIVVYLGRFGEEVIFSHWWEKGRTLILILLITLLLWQAGERGGIESGVKERVPVAAVGYLKGAGGDGRLWHEVEWGSYLSLVGIEPIYIDTQLALYPEAVKADYLTVMQLRADWERPLDEWLVDQILIRRDNPFNALLVERDEWVVGYRDEVAIVWERR